MIIQKPNFANKADLYEWLVKRKEDIFEAKKSEVKKSDPIGSPITLPSTVINKAVTTPADDNDNEIKRTIVGNTYYWMDSHEDVHLSGNFGVSIKQRGVKRIRHYHDHLGQLTAEVGKFNDVYEAPIAWRDLGVDKDGNTEALFGYSTIKKAYNERIFNAYKEGDIDAHSVGMQYSKLAMAINDPEYKEEYAEWQRVFPLLGNPEEAEAKGYFFTVKEAKLFEISCVPDGSNVLTPTLAVQDKTIDPVDASQNKTDPHEAVAKTEVSIYSLLIN